MSTTDTDTIHLQAYGLAPAKPLGEIEVGDVTIYNFGYRYEVLEVIVSESGKTVRLRERNLATGAEYTWTRARRTSTLVGCDPQLCSCCSEPKNAHRPDNGFACEEWTA